MRYLGSIVFALLLSLPAAAQPAPTALDAVKGWERAFNAADAGAIVATYTPDASMWGTVAPRLIVGPAAIREYFEAAFRAGIKVETGGEQSVQPIGDDGMVVSGLASFIVTRDGQERRLPARYTFTLAKRDGGWLILHLHSSPAPAPR